MKITHRLTIYERSFLDLLNRLKRPLMADGVPLAKLVRSGLLRRREFGWAITIEGREILAA